MTHQAGQLQLIEIPEQPAAERAGAGKPAGPGAPKLRGVNRRQKMMAMIDVEELIGEDHKARAIWDLTGRLDLSGFAAPIRSERGQTGRPAWDPRLLVSVWVYAYSEGISSARQIERLMEHEPGLQWLTGLEAVNHHTLSDFRVAHQQALDELFAQLLGLLEEAGAVLLERVMHDGTKIRAQAGVDTFRTGKTIEQRLAQARELVRRMGDPRQQEPGRTRRQAARERARRERIERLEQAWAEWKAWQEKAPQGKRQPLRVSVSEPPARMMKHGDHAIAPSYNAQISTDAGQRVVVGVHLSQCASDSNSLEAALAEVEKNLGRRPRQVVVDGGFTNRATIEAMAGKGVEMIGSLPDAGERSAAAMKALGIDPEFGPQAFVRDPAANALRCPAGQSLPWVRQTRKRGNRYEQYQAPGAACARCALQPRCCPKSPQRGRTVSRLVSEPAAVAAFREKMNSEQARRIYRQRGAVAEFPNAWIKERIGLRKFRVRGLRKAAMEAVWACLTYNVTQWMRLCWRPALASAR